MSRHAHARVTRPHRRVLNIWVCTATTYATPLALGFAHGSCLGLCSRLQVPYAEGSSATPTLNPVLVTEMQAQWGRIARGFYGAWPLYTTDAYNNFDIILDYFARIFPDRYRPTRAG